MERRTALALAGSVIFLGGTLSQPRPPVGDEPDRPEQPAEPAEEEGPDFEATSRDELIDALGDATSGDVVYVPADVTIDLSGIWMLQVPDGVTLASDGRLGGPDGALLTTSRGDEAPRDSLEIKKIRLGEGSRCTGFRLEGHHHEYVNAGEEYDGDYYAHRGTGLFAGTDAVVDNNEISGWVHSGVWAEDNAHVHHNFIHHNTWEGLGYGVSTPAGDNMPVIEHNRFNYNRHSIAGGGGPKVGYVARHNVVGPDWVGHQFDMHGDDGMVGIAGNEIVIQGNTFRATRAVEAKTRNPGGEYPAIFIRGTPVTGVWVEENHFYHDSIDEAYKQTDGPHKVHFSDNTFGRPGEDDEADEETGGAGNDTSA